MCSRPKLPDMPIPPGPERNAPEMQQVAPNRKTRSATQMRGGTGAYRAPSASVGGTSKTGLGIGG